MNKHKTHKGLAKRLKITGSKSNPKVLHGKQGDNHHLRTKKSSQYKNRIGRDKELAANNDKIKTILKHF